MSNARFAIILLGKRELAALLCLFSSFHVIVVWLFHAVPRVCLQFVIVVFFDHTRYFSTACIVINALFRNYNHDNPLCDLFGVVENAAHYFFMVENIQMEDEFLMRQLELFSPLILI